MAVKKMYKDVDDFVGKGGHPSQVLDALARACFNTASHLESDWQDVRSARVWDKLGRDLEAMGDKARKKIPGGGKWPL